MAGEKAPTPIHPGEAAKKLRFIAGELRTLLQNFPATSGGGGGAGSDANSYRVTADENQGRLDIALGSLQVAIESRRAAEGRDALDTVRMYIRREREYRVYAYNTAVGSGSSSPPVSTMAAIKKNVGLIYDLAQQFPTSSDLPTGNMQNMLRAIMAILRTGGYPGAETLIWEEVIKDAKAKETKNNGSEAEAAIAAAVAGG